MHPYRPELNSTLFCQQERCPEVKTSPVSVLCLLTKQAAGSNNITTQDAKASDGHSLRSWQQRQESPVLEILEL